MCLLQKNWSDVQFLVSWACRVWRFITFYHWMQTHFCYKMVLSLQLLNYFSSLENILRRGRPVLWRSSPELKTHALLDKMHQHGNKRGGNFVLSNLFPSLLCVLLPLPALEAGDLLLDHLPLELGSQSGVVIRDLRLGLGRPRFKFTLSHKVHWITLGYSLYLEGLLWGYNEKRTLFQVWSKIKLNQWSTLVLLCITKRHFLLHLA